MSRMASAGEPDLARDSSKPIVSTHGEHSGARQHFDLIIIGAGPAGLSAAARAAELDRERAVTEPSYVLLESGPALAQTIQEYQLGKHVMDEPSFLDLRSPIRFASGSRETVLDHWEADVRHCGINIRYHCEVTGIARADAGFAVALADGRAISGQTVVLAIGTQGNLRLLEVPNDAPSDFVRYSLADPRAFEHKTIVVVGAGDSAIENALALAERNSVHIVNRRSEFSRAKTGNLNAIVAAINDPRIDLTCHYEAKIKRIVLPDGRGGRGALTLATPGGEQTIECDGVIARLGSIPPRGFLERCGIRFSSDLPGALPDLDKRYQSNVPGLYIIGALAGYPLIKQAMNQGQDVVDFIAGNPVQPADHALIVSRLGNLYPDRAADDTLDYLHARAPLLGSISPIVFRELMIESRLLVSGRWATSRTASPTDERGPLPCAAGVELLAPGDFVNAFLLVVEGSLLVRRHRGAAWEEIGVGSFFGESCLFSGRSQSSSVRIRRDSVVLQIPRRILIKLALSNAAVKRELEQTFALNQLRVAFEPKISEPRLRLVNERCAARVYEAGERLFVEGALGTSLYLLLSGTVNLLQGEQGQIVADQYAGELVGQMCLMGHPRRLTTAQAATRVEVLEIDQAGFDTLLEDNAAMRARLERDLTVLLQENNTLLTHRESAAAMEFLMHHGIGEATDALIIDNTLCIGCDNCERACETTHGGIARLDRAAGPSQGRLHIPSACRHCETPHCMKDCPPDAIHRTESGSVYIQDNCIGCGNCESNCPYGAIKLVAPEPPSNWWERWSAASWNPFTRQRAAGDDASGADHVAVKKAVKCDGCSSLPGGPACVRACPTGAAIRLGAGDLLEMLGE